MDTKISFIERTRKVDDLCKTFKCGNVVLDKFLRDESYDTDISKTYLMVENDINIVGFFSLSCSSLLEINNANRIESSAPAVSIKMFAVDQEYQDKKIENYGHTYASFMLIVCLQLIEKIKNDFIGAECIVLNATREGYELYKNIGGFEELDDEYRLPDLYENKSSIKMYRSIESKAN